MKPYLLSNNNALSLYYALALFWFITELFYVCLEWALRTKTKKGAIQTFIIICVLIAALYLGISFFFHVAKSYSLTIPGGFWLYFILGISSLTEWGESIDKNSKVFGGFFGNFLLIILSYISFGLSFQFAWLSHFNIPIQPQTYITIGATCWIIGIAFRLWSVITLGQYFHLNIVVQKDHKIIAHGPYKYIRHPAYAGSFLVFIGIGLMLGNWISILSILIVNYIGFLHRVLMEEKVLKNSLGQKYTEYAKHTKMIIPFVY